MMALTDFLSRALPDVVPMADLDTKDIPEPTEPQYVIRHNPGGLCWHTPQGSHYADVMEVNSMMTTGDMIRPLPMPSTLAGDDTMPEANVVRDAESRIVGLVEYIGPMYYVSQWYEVHRLLTGQIDVAALVPTNAGQFRELI
jgi:hypothetical protein